jgi:hypothetical protein
MTQAMRNGWWRPMNPDAQPGQLLAAGLGAVPMQHEGRWYARQTLRGGGVRALYFTGLGDIQSDAAAAQNSYNSGTTSLAAASAAPDVGSAIQAFLDSANSSLAVMNDAGNTSGAASVQAEIGVITTAQSAAAATSDLSTAQASGAQAQAAASVALSLAQSVAQSNKHPPGGGGNQGEGGSGGGNQPPAGSVTCPAGTVNAGQVVSDISKCGGSTAITTASSGTNWWPWAIAAGVVVGGGAIALAMHHKKKKAKKHAATKH